VAMQGVVQLGPNPKKQIKRLSFAHSRKSCSRIILDFGKTYFGQNHIFSKKIYQSKKIFG
jgi:hypothetical protein